MNALEKRTARARMLENRVERIDARLGALTRRESRFPWLRLAVFLVGSGLTLTGFASQKTWTGWIVLAVFLLIFGVVAGLHRAVIAAADRYKILRQMAVRQLARMNLDWENIPAPPDAPGEKNHPFEFDLNISGPKSLLQLMDTAASAGGSARLRGWLLAEAPDPAASDLRRAAAQEMLPLPGFRARLMLSSALVVARPGERWDGEGVLAWLRRGSQAQALRRLLIPLAGVAVINLMLLALFLLGRVPFAAWLGVLALFWLLQSLKYRETSELFGEAYGLARSLEQFGAVLRHLENYRYAPGSRLADAARPFTEGSARPSQSLRRLSRIVSAAGLRNNPFLGLLLNTLMPWDVFFTYLLEKYKLHLLGSLPAWLDAWYELEAVASLANFALLNPDYTAPQSPPEPDAPVLAAEGRGHPLLPRAGRVTNAFRIQQLGEVFIITGSNMSGKSTFLRTVGVNLVLANAGAVVCAERFASLPFRLFTCINLSDSLSDGISYFYAEVRRLKGLLDALERDQGAPLFFLIDEIFRGTNNRERQQGSQAYTQRLAGKRGSGLISTHDLELAKLADVLPGVHNYHFREDVRDGHMVFDYQLRPGASPTTNALKIMEIEGLPTRLQE